MIKIASRGIFYGHLDISYHEDHKDLSELIFECKEHDYLICDEHILCREERNDTWDKEQVH